MTEPNWAGLWRALTERSCRPEGAQRKGQKPSAALLDFVKEKLRPGDTLLDIGAGGGNFAIPFARLVRSVTAVEPAADAAALLRESAAAHELTNIDLIEARWEDAQVEAHDVAFCSHAMYTSPDLVAFVRKMESRARRLCFLVMRVPSHDGVLRELSSAIHGEPHDSPNFWVGYHVLYDMGIYASVVMEPGVRCWSDASLEDAVQRARRHLAVEDSPARDVLIRETLARRLTVRDGKYYWPDGMRSAMAWWQPSR